METTYDVPRKVWGSLSIEGFGVVDYEIDAGQFMPATPALAAVCERLAAIGMISIADSKPKAKKPAPADNTEE